MEYSATVLCRGILMHSPSWKPPARQFRAVLNGPALSESKGRRAKSRTDAISASCQRQWPALNRDRSFHETLASRSTTRPSGCRFPNASRRFLFTPVLSPPARSGSGYPYSAVMPGDRHPRVFSRSRRFWKSVMQDTRTDRDRSNR